MEVMIDAFLSLMAVRDQSKTNSVGFLEKLWINTGDKEILINF